MFNPVIPYTVSVGSDKYPNLEKVFNELRGYGKLYVIDENKIAKEAGNIITKNIVLLGALAATNILKFKSDILIETILENVPIKFKEINKIAFQEGFKAIKNE